MKVYSIQAPDGKIIDIEGPEGATPQQLSQVAQEHLDRELYSPIKGMSGTEKFLVGTGKAFSDIGTGIKQRISELANIGAPSGQTDIQKQVSETRQLDAPLMQTGSGLAGDVFGNMAILASTARVPGVNTYRGAAALGGLAGLLQPTASHGETAINTGAGALLAPVAQAAGNKIAGLFTPKIQPLAEKTNVDLQSKGFVFPPSQVKPDSLIGQAAESFAGKISTKQLAATKDQELVNTLAAKAIGLPAGVEVTPTAITAAKKEAGAAFDAVENLSPDAKTAVTAWKEANSNANRAWKYYLRNPNPPPSDLKAAQALSKEARDWFGEIESAATQAGRSELVPELQAARVRYAKIGAVERAMNEATGTIDARILGKAAGSKATDELATIREFAKSHPTLTQTPEKRGGFLGASPLTWAASGLLGSAGGLAGGLTSVDPGGMTFNHQNAMLPGGLMALLPFMRAPVRQAILSQAYQKYMANPQTGLLNAMVPGTSSVAQSTLPYIQSQPFQMGGQALRRISPQMGLLAGQAEQ